MTELEGAGFDCTPIFHQPTRLSKHIDRVVLQLYQKVRGAWILCCTAVSSSHPCVLFAFDI
jgi:hypothetical protein